MRTPLARFARRSVVLTLLLAGITPTLPAQGGPPPHVARTMQAIERAFDSAADSLLTRLVQERFTEAYRATEGVAGHVARLKALRAKLGGMFAGVSIERDSDGFVLTIGGKVELSLRVVLDDAGAITKLVEEQAKDAWAPAVDPSRLRR